MTSTRALRHRAAALALFATFWTMSSGRPCARPTPAQEWIVTPPTLLAAMPVGAVTATESSPWRRRSSWMTYRRRKDLPVPAAPLKKTFSPRIARSAAERCSIVRESADTAAAAEDDDDDEEEDDGAARSFWAAISRSISADVAALSENAAAAAGVYEAENVPELAAADEDAEEEDEDEDEAADEDSAEAADPDDDADE